MDFYDVVDQAVKLLQQRGRLTYRLAPVHHWCSEGLVLQGTNTKGL